MEMTEARVRRRAEFSRQICQEITRQFRSGHFRYTDFSASELLHFVSVGKNGWVAVIGEPDSGSYEWVIRHDGEFHGQTDVYYDHSDSGYGCPESALRDGLKECLGD
jgi:hypothetical protein